jgi:hypothetical protein
LEGSIGHIPGVSKARYIISSAKDLSQAALNIPQKKAFDIETIPELSLIKVSNSIE